MTNAEKLAQTFGLKADMFVLKRCKCPFQNPPEKGCAGCVYSETKTILTECKFDRDFWRATYQERK